MRDVVDLQIISDFPEIFTQFHEKRFTILWRETRDGFAGSEFHRRCDRHANTLTMILDAKENIFDGFTPVKWESRAPNSCKDNSNCSQSDENLKSFLFTLENPHNAPARRLALKDEIKDRAIYCDSRRARYLA
jgi:hypothetical protein